MPMLRTIDRPTSATRRPCRDGDVEHLLHAVHVAGEAGDDDRAARPCAITSSSTGPISRSAITKPGTSALVESTRNRSTPSSPRREKPGEVGEPAVERQLVELDVAGVQHQPGRRADGDRQRVRDRVVDREVLAVELAVARAGRPRPPPRRCGVSRCSLHLAATSASVNREPTTGRSGRWRSRNGTAPMWSSWPWVSTSASMSSSAVLDGPEVGQDQVDARLLVLAGTARRSRRSSSRPSYSKTVMLRPISPMPPSATTRRPPSGRRAAPVAASSVAVRHREPARRWCGWWSATYGRAAGVRPGPTRAACHVATAAASASGTPAAPRSAAIAATCSSVAGGSGSRGSPTSMAAQAQRGLREDHAADPAHRPEHRQQSAVDGAGAGRRRRPRTPPACARSRSATTCPMTLTKPTPPTDEPRQVQRVVAGVVGEVGGRDDLAAGEQVALGVLHRDDPRVLGEPAQRVHLDRARRCAAGCRRA